VSGCGRPTGREGGGRPTGRGWAVVGRERAGGGWQGEGGRQVNGRAAWTARAGGAYRAGEMTWAVSGCNRVVGGQSGASPALDTGEAG